MGGVIGMITGSTARKAAKEQAKATLKVASDQAASDRLTAQGAQQSREAMIAQDQASRLAATELSIPQERLEVNLAPPAPVAEIDPVTGRRASTRSSFMSARPSVSRTGLQIQ